MPYSQRKLKSKKKMALDLFLSVAEVETICPACADTMRSRNIKAVNLKCLPEDVAEIMRISMREQYGENFTERGFFNTCVANNGSRFSDAVNVCAALQQFALNSLPSDEDFAGALFTHTQMSNQPSIEGLTGGAALPQEKKSDAPTVTDAPRKEARTFFDAEVIRMEAESDTIKKGTQYEVVIMEAGLNLKGVYYSSEVLQREAARFEGAKCYAYKYELPTKQLYTHIDEGGLPIQKTGALVGNYVGFFSNVRFGEFLKPDGTKHFGLLARLTILSEWVRGLLCNMFEEGDFDEVGLSIDVNQAMMRGSIPGIVGEVDIALAILDVHEVTLVTSPAAGGRFLRMAADFNIHRLTTGDSMGEIKTMLLQFFPELAALHGITVDSDEATLTEKLPSIFQKLCAVQTGYVAYAQSLAAANTNANRAANGQANIPIAPVLDDAKLAEIIAAVESRMQGKVQTQVTEVLHAQNSIAATGRLVDQLLGAAKMPDKAQERVRRITAGRALTAEEINVIIAEEQAYAASLTPNTGFNLEAPAQGIRVGREELDTFQAAMDGMILGERIKDVKPFVGLHQSYHLMTGFHASPGALGRRIMMEAIFSTAPLGTPQEKWRDFLKSKREASGVYRVTADTLETSMWAEVFGDSMRKALIKYYLMPKYDVWRRVVSLVSPLSDFRTNRRQRIGGFGDLEIVGQAAPYQELTHPADEEVSYAPQKRGNIVSLAWETFVNDDLGAVRDTPKRLGIAAVRTLYKFVFDLYRTNPTFDSDSVAVFHASHGNLGTTALSSTTLDAAILAMKSQTELSSGERLGIVPKLLLSPFDLSRTSWELTKSQVSTLSGRAETVKNWFENYAIDPIEVNYWSDTNDVVLVADPAEWPTIEIGFLDGNEEPELFVQDQPQYGSNFTADKMAWKIRHIYGGDVLDFRTAYKMVVS